VVDPVDEVVYVVRGQIKVTQGRKAAVFGPGASYLVPARSEEDDHGPQDGLVHLLLLTRRPRTCPGRWL